LKKSQTLLKELYMKNRVGKGILEKGILLFLLFAAAAIGSCAGSASVKNSGAVFTDVQGKDWVLVETQSASGTIRLDREQLAGDGFEGIYTIKFDEDRVAGMGAPNRYFGPYSQGEGKALTIGNVAGTLMAPLREPDGLKEHEYFALLGKVSRWDLREGRLELFTVDAGGNSVTLIFE
jgi:heat shock protein HslJ